KSLVLLDMERVITVSLQMQAANSQSARESMEELLRLVDTAGGQVIHAVTQKRGRPDPATLIGRGKAEELAIVGKKNAVHTFVFDQPLKPAQQRHLEEILSAK